MRIFILAAFLLGNAHVLARRADRNRTLLARELESTSQSHDAASSLKCGDIDTSRMNYLDSGFQASVFAGGVLGSKYVVKVAKGNELYSKMAEKEKMFKEECRILRKLEDADVPQVNRCKGYCTVRGRPALILTRARGTAFKKGQIEGSLAFQKRAVLEMLIIGLAVLDENIVNTDQQPNILFDTDGTATFIDFGAATDLDGVTLMRDYYIAQYLLELFFLIPDSLLGWAEKKLSQIQHTDEISRHLKTAFQRLKSNRGAMSSANVTDLPRLTDKMLQGTQAGLEARAARLVEEVAEPRPGEVIRVKNDVMMCPSNPCKGLPVGKIAECLSEDFEVVYSRCCKGRRLKGSLQAVLVRSCDEFH